MSCFKKFVKTKHQRTKRGADFWKNKHNMSRFNSSVSSWSKQVKVHNKSAQCLHGRWSKSSVLPEQYCQQRMHSRTALSIGHPRLVAPMTYNSITGFVCIKLKTSGVNTAGFPAETLKWWRWSAVGGGGWNRPVSVIPVLQDPETYVSVTPVCLWF